MVTNPFDLDPNDLRAVLDQQRPKAVAGAQAAVAVIAHPGRRGTELLFIQRATKPTDPWSGQMAFPGGRVDPVDTNTFAAAERETLEEVGLDISDAPRLGSLRMVDGGRARSNLKAVFAHVYWYERQPPALTNNHEVADSLWVPLRDLADSDRHIDYYWAPADSTWPGIQLDAAAQVIWGMTLRFLGDLFARLEAPFIDLPPAP